MRDIIVTIVLTTVVFFGIIYYVSTSYQPQKQSQQVMASQTNQTMQAVRSGISDTDPISVNLSSAQTLIDTYYADAMVYVSVGNTSNKAGWVDVTNNVASSLASSAGAEYSLSAAGSISALKAALTSQFYTQRIFKDTVGNTFYVRLDAIN
jgi:hypothetical protein